MVDATVILLYKWSERETPKPPRITPTIIRLRCGLYICTLNAKRKSSFYHIWFLSKKMSPYLENESISDRRVVERGERAGSLHGSSIVFNHTSMPPRSRSLNVVPCALLQLNQPPTPRVRIVHVLGHSCHPNRVGHLLHLILHASSQLIRLCIAVHMDFLSTACNNEHRDFAGL